jgi:hypothetical protein
MGRSERREVGRGAMTADDISLDDWDDDGGAVPESDLADLPDDLPDDRGAGDRGAVDVDHRPTHRQLALLGVAALVVAVAALLMPRGR